MLPVPQGYSWYSPPAHELRSAKEWHVLFASHSFAVAATQSATVAPLSHEPFISSAPQLQCAFVQPLSLMQLLAEKAYPAGGGGHPDRATVSSAKQSNKRSIVLCNKRLLLAR